MTQINYQTKDKTQLPEGGIVKCRAIYNDKILVDYRGNPLNEALPPDRYKSGMTDALEYLPAYNTNDRKMSPEDRYAMVRRLLRLFIVLPQHRTLAEKLQGVIRGGYIGRNPIIPGYYRYTRKRVIRMLRNMGMPVDPAMAQFGVEDDESTVIRTIDELLGAAHGFQFIGLSGMGKSTTLRKILSRYPQVLLHDMYKGVPCSFQQVVWLHLECPSDGRLNGLCERFFEALDELLDSNYHSWAVTGGKQKPQHLLVPMMGLLAQLHGIGVLVIDEIQRLSEARSGGHFQMLNFFSELTTTIGVPVVLVGTPKAQTMLTSEFRQTRRGCGEGETIWSRLKEDKAWHEFLQSLWHYQYTCKESPLELKWDKKDSKGRAVPVVPSELSHVMYDETQGIVDLAVKLFMLAQTRAIRSGVEMVNKDIIRSVAYDSFGSARGALDALRRNDSATIAQLGDLNLDIDRLMDREISRKAA